MSNDVCDLWFWTVYVICAAEYVAESNSPVCIFSKNSQYVPGSSHVWKHPDVLVDIESSETKLKWKLNEQIMGGIFFT